MRPACPPASEIKSLLEVAQTVSLLSTISEREKDQNVVTLSTLHAAKGLEWPHVMLVGVTEGMLPFKLGDGADALGGVRSGARGGQRGMAQRLQEERRLMYVGITRAQRSLAVSWTRKRKKGREMVAAQPSRFIAEMALDQATVKEDPREKLSALRAEFAKKAQDTRSRASAGRGGAARTEQFTAVIPEQADMNPFDALCIAAAYLALEARLVIDASAGPARWQACAQLTGDQRRAAGLL